MSVTFQHILLKKGGLLLGFIVISVTVFCSGVFAQSRVSPSEIQQMNSIIKYLDKKISVNSPKTNPSVRLTALLESCSLLGFNVDDRNAFTPDMSVSEISVVLLGSQLPSRRKVIVNDAQKVLHLKREKNLPTGTAKAFEKNLSPVKLIEESSQVQVQSLKTTPLTTDAGSYLESLRKKQQASQSAPNTKYVELDSIVTKVLSGLPVVKKNPQSDSKRQ